MDVRGVRWTPEERERKSDGRVLLIREVDLSRQMGIMQLFYFIIFIN